MTSGQGTGIPTSTTFELPGYTVEGTLGLCWGLIVRSVGLTKGLSVRGDPREVVADPEARYYGALLEERTLLPSADALTLDPRFEDWLVQTAPPK